MSAAWATQKIAEQSARWKQQIKPAKPINVPPEIKASTIPHNYSLQGWSQEEATSSILICILVSRSQQGKRIVVSIDSFPIKEKNQCQRINANLGISAPSGGGGHMRATPVMGMKGVSKPAEVHCPVLCRRGCSRGLTWLKEPPRHQDGWLRRRATSPSALLRALCAA